MFVLVAEVPCEWKFATKFASECECDGVVHSEPDPHQSKMFMLCVFSSPCLLFRKLAFEDTLGMEGCGARSFLAQ